MPVGIMPTTLTVPSVPRHHAHSTRTLTAVTFNTPTALTVPWATRGHIRHFLIWTMEAVDVVENKGLVEL